MWSCLWEFSSFWAVKWKANYNSFQDPASFFSKTHTAKDKNVALGLIIAATMSYIKCFEVWLKLFCLLVAVYLPPVLSPVPHKLYRWTLCHHDKFECGNVRPIFLWNKSHIHYNWRCCSLRIWNLPDLKKLFP